MIRTPRRPVNAPQGPQRGGPGRCFLVLANCFGQIVYNCISKLRHKQTMTLPNMRQAAVVLLMLISSNGWAERGHEFCTACHLSAKPNAINNELVRPLTTLCTECHMGRDKGLDHAVGVSMTPGSSGWLPLIGGRIECVTCHDSHTTGKGFLRVEPKELCISCHRDH
ncbi:MAG TPA: hypothetical protein ENI99_07285 [Sedimenticola sp.]|nr:hypothetical protein [Sedimenticola sp.]